MDRALKLVRRNRFAGSSTLSQPPTPPRKALSSPGRMPARRCADSRYGSSVTCTSSSSKHSSPTSRFTHSTIADRWCERRLSSVPVKKPTRRTFAGENMANASRYSRSSSTAKCCAARVTDANRRPSSTGEAVQVGVATASSEVATGDDSRVVRIANSRTIPGKGTAEPAPPRAASHTSSSAGDVDFALTVTGFVERHGRYVMFNRASAKRPRDGERTEWPPARSRPVAPTDEQCPVARTNGPCRGCGGDCRANSETRKPSCVPPPTDTDSSSGERTTRSKGEDWSGPPTSRSSAPPSCTTTGHDDARTYECPPFRTHVSPVQSDRETHWATAFASSRVDMTTVVGSRVLGRSSGRR
mmetsp:Transcript_16002/g.50000  ORF Transcript_16002/g.50000 Transcript_16002/m.50000 type:complete len:357 (+) Transcript_16002:2196-3266(+)